MLELLAAIDNVNEPSRDTDLAIHIALWPEGDVAKISKYRRGLDHQDGYSWELRGAGLVYEKWIDGRCPVNGGVTLPSYTASIDDALKLLRKHYLWQLKQGIECCGIVWWLEKDWDETGPPTAYSSEYPALALTKAILLARAVEDRLCQVSRHERGQS